MSGDDKPFRPIPLWQRVLSMGARQVLLVSEAIIALVHYSAASARRQGLKCQASSRGFPVVTEVDRLTHRRELAGVPERPLVIETPELTGEEALVTGEETGRARRLVLIERLGIGV